MSNDNSRSEAVVDAYKQDKLSRSALRQIRALIAEFDRSRKEDARLAVVGAVMILALIGVALYFFFSGDKITLS